MRVEYKLRKYKITFFKFWSRIEIAPQDDGVGSRLLEYLVHQLVNLLDAVVLVVVAVAVRRGGHRVGDVHVQSHVRQVLHVGQPDPAHTFRS